MMRRLALLGLLLPMVISMSHAQLPQTPAPGSSERSAILEAARAPAQADLSRPVQFQVNTLNVVGDWAFLYADLRDAQGQPIDYAGTSLADEAAQGGRSKSYAALLRREDGGWTVRRHRTGPTDAVWLSWSDVGAPDAVYQIDD